MAARLVLQNWSTPPDDPATAATQTVKQALNAVPGLTIVELSAQSGVVEFEPDTAGPISAVKRRLEVVLPAGWKVYVETTYDLP